ncbi:MAG: DUF1653 domain-containing protein [Candidatus Saccharimonadales bacterium]
MKDLPPYSLEAKNLKIGKYRHYSGKDYDVIGVCRHSETLEEMVVYKALYGEGDLWVRPLVMFMEDVEVSGSMQPRFKFIG